VPNGRENVFGIAKGEMPPPPWGGGGGTNGGGGKKIKIQLGKEKNLGKWEKGGVLQWSATKIRIPSWGHAAVRQEYWGFEGEAERTPCRWR